MLEGLVLNIDSDAAGRARISGVLRAAGAQVQDAEGVEDSVRLLQDIEPAAVLVAPIVGDVPGIELCAQLRGAACVLRVPAKQVARVTEDCVAAILPEPVADNLLVKTVGLVLGADRERRQAESLRRELEQLRQEFHLCISRTSHDLAQAVRGFATFAELVQQGGVDRLSPGEARYLEQVLEATDRSRRLLRYLSSYVQVTREPASAHRNVDLNGVVMAAEAQLRDEIERVGATIRIEDLPIVRGNPSRLQQLVGCLLSNSLKYRHPEKALHIVIQAARDAGDRWVISVSDNGVGLEAQHHESIFAPFHRLHGREVPGTGMGLALGRKIVEAHHGQLLVKSAPGQGATFLFTLPAAA